MDRDHGGGAGCLNREAGSLQIQLVRDPGTEKVLVRIDQSRNVVLSKLAAQPAIHEIGIESASSKNANASGIAIWVIARILNRLMRQLQQNAMLGVDGPGFAGQEAKEIGIKLARVFQDWRGLHVVRIAKPSSRHS